MKKTLSLFITLLLAAVLCCAFFIPCAAEGAKIENDFAYQLSKDGKSAEIIGYTGSGGSVAIPDRIGSVPVVAIADSVFFNIDGITDISLPASLKEIGKYQFVRLPDLTSITVADGSGQFSSVSGVLYSKSGDSIIRRPEGQSGSSFTVPDGVKSVAPHAFYANRALVSVSIPDGLTEIGDYAFYACGSLTEFSAPASLEKIGMSAFSWCLGLKRVSLPEELTQIGRWAFDATYFANNYEGDFVMLGDVLLDYNGNGTDVVIPDGVKAVVSAFMSNETIKSVVIPDSVTTVGDYAFYGCIELKSAALPQNLKSIGDYSFFGCSKLEAAEIPQSVSTVGDYAFAACDALRKVSVGAKTIGDNAFTRNPKLKTMQLGDGIDAVGGFAFAHNYALSSLSLPDSTASLGKGVCLDCHALGTVSIGSGVKKIGKYAFSGCPLVKISAPKKSYARKYADSNGLKLLSGGSSDSDSSSSGSSGGSEPGGYSALSQRLLFIFLPAFLILLGAAVLILYFCNRRLRKKKQNDNE